MSRILELAEKAKKKEEAEALETQEVIRSAWQKHEQDLLAQLKKDYQTISVTAEQERQKVISSLWKIYTIPAYCLVVIMFLMLGGMIYFGNQVNNDRLEAQEWRKSAELYKAQSQNIKFGTCTMKDKTSRICVQVDPQYQDQSWEGDYKVLTVKAN
ncbi:MbeB family mobilization protein [Commensalibacter intestini]|uniref:MbeB family mobilization protein n=1 Tax=Commensalibacter intestini TaxID=479936 RepID=UPI00351E3006